MPGPRGSAFTTPVDLGNSVLPASLEKYERVLADYDAWAVPLGFPVVAGFCALPARAVNALMVARLQQMSLDASPPSHGSFLMAGLVNRHPWLRRSLAEAWHALRIWQRAVPVNNRTGLDERILWAMVAVAVTWGWHLCAAALIIGFEGLLRPGEIGILLREDIRLPCDSQGLPTSVVVVQLRVPKTRRRAARHQSVVLRRPEAVGALTRLLWSIPRNWLLCGGGTAGLRGRFRALLRGLGIPESLYSPASLRPGGTIAYHLRCDDLGRLLYHGRWDSVRTVQHYLHEGVAAVTAAALPPRAAALMQQLVRLLPDLLAEVVCPHSVP